MSLMTITTTQPITIDVDGACFVECVIGEPTTYTPLLNRNGKETTIIFTVDIK